MMIRLIAVSFACPKDPHKLLLKVVSEISWKTQNGISGQLETVLLNFTKFLTHWPLSAQTKFPNPELYVPDPSQNE